MHPISAGVDWISDNRTDQNPNSLITANPKFPELNNNNPGRRSLE